MASLWQRFRDRVAGWFRGPETPGRFEAGSKFSLNGWVSTVPTVWPARDYLVYVPKGRSRWKRAPLLVLCHGCRQTAEDIATGTKIQAMADREGIVVLLPQQKDAANPWRCWNWFESRTAQGNGEAAIVAAQIRAVSRAYRIDRKRVVAAGMSAGGALAAVLGVRHPDLVTGVAVHSGLACGAARGPLTAMSVMRDGPDVDVEAIAQGARTRASPQRLRVPLLAIHGAADTVVDPCNAIALVRQYLALNGRPDESATPARDLPPPDDTERETLAAGRTQTTREWRRDGRLVARYVEVSALGHAWSGGDPAAPHTDPAPPDAAALIAGFFRDGLSSRS